MRLFTAIDIPEEVRAALRVTVGRWKPLAKISWSPIDNLHITTKFIGEWPEARLEDMKQALTSVSSIHAIDIAIRGIGWFPNAQRPRVLWAGVEAGEPLTKLAQATEQAGAGLGVAVEARPYAPHLTLARIREAVALDSLRTAIGHLNTSQATTNFGSFRAQAFSLYLSAAGRYTPIATFPLSSSSSALASSPSATLRSSSL